MTHMRIHSSLLKFRCNIELCNVTYSSLHTYRKHLYGVHFKKQVKVISHIDLKCSIRTCGQSFYEYSKLISHLRNHLRSGLSITCPHENCSKKISALNSFSSHLFRFHYKAKDTSGLNLQLSSNDCIEKEIEQSDSQNGDLAQDIGDHSGHEDKLIRKNTMQFFLKLLSKHLVPSSTVDLIAKEMANLIEIHQGCVVSRINESNIENKNSVLDIVGNDILKDALQTVQSKYLRQKNFEQNFPYISPREIVLGKKKRAKL